MEKSVQYENWWSKLLFGKSFDRQFFIPIPPRPMDEKLINWIEKKKFSKGFENLEIKKPIFIVGLPRSGTTLLYNLLCAHENAAYVTNSMNAFPDAPCAIEWLRKKLKLNIRGERFLKDSIDTDFGSPSEPVMFWGKWVGRDAETLNWRTLREKDLTEKQKNDFYTDIKKILFCFGGIGKRFICKYPIFQTELLLIQDLFPDAHFVHIIRDPRQVSNSLVKLHNLANEQVKRIKHPLLKSIITYPRVPRLVEYIEKYGADSIDCTARVWEDSVDIVQEVSPLLNNYKEIRYEDILVDPTKELTELFRFCKLNWPSSNSRFDSEFKRIGKVHHKNNYRNFEKITKILSPKMAELGYL